MRDAGAILTASQMVHRPALVRVMRKSALPKGMTFLLEVAVGEAEALAEAERLTGAPPDVQRNAACFFVEQVLFIQGADHYRVLGATITAPTSELRYHMALLMRWLHPDARARQPQGEIDRSVFAARITEAWKVLKSSEGRAAYDASLRSAPVLHASRKSRARRIRQHPMLSLHPLKGEGWLGRLFLLLQGRR